MASREFLLDILRVFFFKQKTAYGIKECDWSSDVCSSDLSPVCGDVVRRRRGITRDLARYRAANSALELTALGDRKSVV